MADSFNHAHFRPMPGTPAFATQERTILSNLQHGPSRTMVPPPPVNHNIQTLPPHLRGLPPPPMGYPDVSSQALARQRSMSNKSRLVEQMNSDLVKLRQQLKRLMGEHHPLPDANTRSLSPPPYASQPNNISYEIPRPPPLALTPSYEPKPFPRAYHQVSQNNTLPEKPSAPGSINFAPYNKNYNNYNPVESLKPQTGFTPQQNPSFYSYDHYRPTQPEPISAPPAFNYGGSNFVVTESLNRSSQFSQKTTAYNPLPIPQPLASTPAPVPAPSPIVAPSTVSTPAQAPAPAAKTFVAPNIQKPIERRQKSPEPVAKTEEPKHISSPFQELTKPSPVPEIKLTSNTNSPVPESRPKSPPVSKPLPVEDSSASNTPRVIRRSDSKLEQSAYRRDVSPVSVRLGSIEENLRKELDKKFQEIKELKQEKSKKEDSIRALQEKVKQLELTVKNNSVTSLSTSYSEAKEQQLQNENKTLRAQIEQHIKEKNDLIRRMDILTKSAAAEVNRSSTVPNSIAAHSQYEEAVKGLRNTKERLEKQLDSAHKEIQKLKGKLEEKYLSGESYFDQKAMGSKESDTQIVRLQKENMLLRQQLANSKKTGFDDMLKNHIEEANRYKENLSDRNEEIRRLEEVNRIQKSKLDNYANEFEVERLKNMSERKAMEQEFESQKLALNNEIETLRKGSIAVASRLKLFVDENQRKDDFIKQWVSGKVYTEQNRLDVKEFFRQYEVAVPPGNLAASIRRDTVEIERLQREIAHVNILRSNQQQQYAQSMNGVIG